MPALLSGKEKPRNAIEHRRVSELCYEFKQYGAATRFWSEFFARHPEAEDRAGRYDAACAAALAGTGRSKDAVQKPAEARAKALAWLEQSLAELSEQPTGQLQQRLNHWKRDGDLAGVRDDLSKLPAEERASWQEFWKSVDRQLAAAGD